jgi:hypothetical protein
VKFNGKDLGRERCARNGRPTLQINPAHKHVFKTGLCNLFVTMWKKWKLLVHDLRVIFTFRKIIPSTAVHNPDTTGNIQ